MEDLSEYFKPETSSIQSFFLTQIGTGFAVPVYQRPYSWDNDKITKLVVLLQFACWILKGRGSFTEFNKQK